MTAQEPVTIEALAEARLHLKRVCARQVFVFVAGALVLGAGLGTYMFFLSGLSLSTTLRVSAVISVFAAVVFVAGPLIHYLRVFRHFARVEARVLSGIAVPLAEALYKRSHS